MNDIPQMPVSRDDFVHALQDMGTYIDVSVDDLMELQRRAVKFAQLRRNGDRSVQSMMSRAVVSVTEDCPLSAAAHLLVTRKISGLPVVDEQRKLIGIISEADFLCALGVECHHPTYSLWQTLEHLFKQERPEARVSGKVGELMSRQVITITPQRHLQDAIELMKQHHIKRLVVCDDERHVLGMLTRSDLVRVFFDRFNQHRE
jgi:CBS-domain-containing membrane protein